MSRKTFDDGPACCVCGCTQNNACDGGCAWVAADLCSACEAAWAAAVKISAALNQKRNRNAPLPRRRQIIAREIRKVQDAMDPQLS